MTTGLRASATRINHTVADGCMAAQATLLFLEVSCTCNCSPSSWHCILHYGAKCSIVPTLHPTPDRLHRLSPPTLLQVPGSVAHLLKAQGFVQSLSVGAGDEVRLGAGWMYWGATLTLTQEGEDQLAHVLATLMRGVQVSLGGGGASCAQTILYGLELADA